MKSESRETALVHYGEAVKHEVAAAIKGGMSYQHACSKYGIKSASTVCKWMKTYGGGKKVRKMRIRDKQSTESEALAKSAQEKRELELALARMSLKTHCLETVIEEASKYYREDVKKKFTQQ